MAILLNGCAGHRDRQILNLANQKGSAEAGLNLPSVPAECKEKMPHAPLVAGQELATTLLRERKQLDKANNRLVDCAQFNEQLKAELEAR